MRKTTPQIYSRNYNKRSDKKVMIKKEITDINLNEVEGDDLKHSYESMKHQVEQIRKSTDLSDYLSVSRSKSQLAQLLGSIEKLQFNKLSTACKVHEDVGIGEDVISLNDEGLDSLRDDILSLYSRYNKLPRCCSSTTLTTASLSSLSYSDFEDESNDFITLDSDDDSDIDGYSTDESDYETDDEDYSDVDETIRRSQSTRCHALKLYYQSNAALTLYQQQILRAQRIKEMRYKHDEIKLQVSTNNEKRGQYTEYEQSKMLCNSSRCQESYRNRSHDMAFGDSVFQFY